MNYWNLTPPSQMFYLGCVGQLY